MKKAIASFAAAAVASLGLVAPAATAGDGGQSSGSPDCVSRAEFDQVQTDAGDTLGTHRVRVHRIFDTRGELYGQEDGHIGASTSDAGTTDETT